MEGKKTTQGKKEKGNSSSKGVHIHSPNHLFFFFMLDRIDNSSIKFTINPIY